MESQVDRGQGRIDSPGLLLKEPRKKYFSGFVNVKEGKASLDARYHSFI